jgi:DNA-binding NarL/FixJ family response regulator
VRGVSPDERDSRVLLGPLGPLVRLGVSSTLTMDGNVEIVGDEDETDAAVSAAGQLAPDVIILGGDPRAAKALSDRLRAAAPAATLIFCPTDERIEVLDPGTSKVRRCPATAADGLRLELSRRHDNAQE